MQSDQSTNYFSASSKQGTKMHMRTCTHGQQTDGNEID